MSSFVDVLEEKLVPIAAWIGKNKHINGIENFRNQAKRHLRKSNGYPLTTLDERIIDGLIFNDKYFITLK